MRQDSNDILLLFCRARERHLNSNVPDVTSDVGDTAW